MKPDSAIIYFTVSSGTGYGMIIALLSIIFTNHINISINIKLLFAFISFFLIISGLLSSTIHLGHPLRAWRSLSQWKSSWLSREGLLAIITFLPLTAFYIIWVFSSNFILTYFFLLSSSALSLATVFCTAKIYSSIKAIPAWHNPLVTVIYLLNSLVMGSLFAFSLFYCFKIEVLFLSNSIIILSFSTLFIKILYWYSIKKKSKSDISTATGLGNSKATSFFEGPHTGENFLTKEMINKINLNKSIILRISFCIFTYVTPAFYIFQNNNLITSHYLKSITFIIISIIALLGMFIERYLFFIEAKHTVSLFYGNKTI